MLAHWIWLATRPGMSSRVKWELLQHFRDPEDIYFAGEDAFRQIGLLPPEAVAGLTDKDLTPAEAILADCDMEDIRVVTIQDAAYPGRLKNIADPPLVLYYKGRLPEFDALPAIGVVGTRMASPYGITMAKRLGFQIAKCGGVVVSGMAYGIDGVAMSGALTAGGMVVGVLGCGVDVVYPVSNRGLYEDLKNSGCILSEFPPRTPAHKWNFPKRNRIISGLSSGVLVVEAPEKSGALITASLALEQGRDVFAVPGNIGVASCAGTNRLLRDGATLVSSGWDILGEYLPQYPGKIRRYVAPGQQTAYPDELEKDHPVQEKTERKVAQKPLIPEKAQNKKVRNDKKVIDNGASPPYSDVNKAPPDLTGDDRIIADALAGGEMLVDDLIAQTGLGAAKVLSLLTILELKGVVRRLPGKRVILN